MELETEVHISFPNKRETKLPEYQDTSIEKLWPVTTSTNSENEEPVIVLLGWAGCEHKYLSKYSDFYLNRGCITVRHITPLRYHFVENHKILLLAQGIIKFICDHKLDSRPIFFHVFSNGGSYTYSYILKELAKTQKSRLDIRGTIFDSSPCPRNLRKSYSALLSVFAHLKSYVAAGLLIFFVICQIFWYHLKVTLCWPQGLFYGCQLPLIWICSATIPAKVAVGYKNSWNKFLKRSEPPCCPTIASTSYRSCKTAVTFCIFGDSLDSLENRDIESAPLTNWLGRIVNLKNHNFLFLYSDSDELIPMKQVERFASIIASRGSSVKKVRFIGSEHVMHYRRYPKEYGNAIQEFFQTTMAKHQPRIVISDD